MIEPITTLETASKSYRNRDLLGQGARNADPDGRPPSQRGPATVAADGALCHGYPVEQPLDGAGVSEQAATWKKSGNIWKLCGISMGHAALI